MSQITVYVQSNTLVGDFHHPRGVVVAQVVKANIPVRNGVIHLIEKPLIVIDIDIVNFLKVIISRIFVSSASHHCQIRLF